MSSSFPDSLSQPGYDSFSTFTYSESMNESATDSTAFNHSNSYAAAGDDVFVSQAGSDTSPPPIYVEGFGSDQPDFSSFSPEANGKVLNGEFSGSEGPILPPPMEMQSEEGFALREWRRLNAIRLEEKQKREKELLSHIIDEADEYKADFSRRRQITCENNKATNREKEKSFLAIQEKFHKEADSNYWKAIAELVPNEVPTIEKRRGKKDQDKKPSIVVIQGPKPGKPTDRSRMRQILLKLKHNTPPHLKPAPPVAPASPKDAKSSGSAVAANPLKDAAVTTTPETIAAA